MTTPYSVVRLGVTGSTQYEARRRWDGEPVLVVADAQTAGRGRAGSVWESAPAAAAMSLAIRPAWPVTDWPLLPLVAAVVAARLIGCDVKWPNDLLRAGSKVGGILVEAGDGPVVIGMGLNLWWPDAPTGYGALHTVEPAPDTGALLATAWARDLLTIVDAEPSEWPRHEYVERCVTIGNTITWDPNGHGRAVDVGGDGALIVETDSGPEEIRSGEVRHVRTE